MKIQNLKRNILIAVLLTSLSSSVFSASSKPQDDDKNRTCSIICVNENWMLKSYNKGSKSTPVNLNSKGLLTVRETGDIGNWGKHDRKVFIPFQISIKRNGEVLHLDSFDGKEFEKIEITEVLKVCKKGDIIVVKPSGDKWDLVDNELPVL